MSADGYIQLKRLVRIVGGSTPPSRGEFWGGSVTWYTPTDVASVHGGTLGESARTLSDGGLAACSASVVPAGSVVVTTRAPVGNIALTDRPAAVNQGCKVLVPLDETDGRFIAYALRSVGGALQSTATGTTFQEVSGHQLGRLYVPHLDPATQALAADFLDQECGRIRLVRQKSEALAHGALEELAWRLSDRLREREQDRVPLRRLIRRISDGPFGSSLASAHYVTAPGTRVIRLANVGEAEFLGADEAYVSNHYARTELSEHFVEPGDVVIAGLGDEQHLLGRACVVPSALGPAINKADCYRVQVDHARVSPEYLAWALSFGPARDEAGLLARGATRQRLNTGSARKLPVPVMSLAEQSRFVSEAADHRLRVRRMLGQLEQLMDGLAEYRDALITEAVTGKLDVTHLSESQLHESVHAAMEGERSEVLSA